MTPRAIIFDCDGVLADTERDGHLPAFNTAFAAFGVPLHWSQAEYSKHLQIGGGKERIAQSLTPELLRHVHVCGAAQRERLIRNLHAAKTTAFKASVAAGKLPARPGIARLARELHARGWRLGVASTSAEESVRAVLASVVDAALVPRFSVFAGDLVAHKKPAPDIYRIAIERMGVDARSTLAIEDSRNGLLAATAAGLACVVTPTSFTQAERMDEAVLVVSSLGEPNGVATRVIANRSGVRVGGYVRAEDLCALLR